jgi:hypothetical protein
MRRQVYICLFIALLSVASLIAQKFELILTERLEKQIYKDKIPAAIETISYADFYGWNTWGRQVQGYHPGRSASGREMFLIVSPVEQGNNEINVLVTIIEPDHNDLSEDVYNRPINKETELMGNLSLTPEEKLSLIAFLNTLADGNVPDQPQSAQSED